MQEYNISYSLDSKYSEQLAVSIASILKNAENSDNINFYILDGGISKEDKENLEKLKSLKAFNIEYIKVDNKDFKSCPLLKDNKKDYHVTLPTYYRFKLPQYLNKLDKVLYLDCDVIIRTSLKDLFNLDITKYPAAMVLDAESKKEAKRLNVKKYFNAGVMLINLDYWRKNNIENLLFDYAVNNKDKILWQDQDIINCVLDGKIKELDNIWNFQYFQYEKVDNKQLSDINIFHLAGRFKPWLMPFEHTIYDLYYYYLSFSAWKNKIEEYKQTGSGKFLKNGIGGSITNITVNATDEDIQKVYKEINKNYEFIKNNTQDINTKTDSKINVIYDEIGKTYDFTKSEIKNLKDITNSNTDKKISKIYDELTKNYNYTNELNNNIKSELTSLSIETNDKINNLINENTIDSERKINAIYDEIGKNYDFTTKEIESAVNNSEIKTTEKVEQIYQEISKNYEFTKNEISSAINTSQVNTDKKISEIYDEISKNYSFTKDEINSAFNILENKTNEKVTQIYDEITKNYEYTNSIKDDSLEQIKLLSDDFNNKLQNNISEIRSNNEAEIKELRNNLSEIQNNNETRIKELKKVITEQDKNNSGQQEILNNKIINIYDLIAQETATREEISNNLRNEFNTLNINTNTITDEKISKVYDEITKNYKYTEYLVQEAEEKQNLKREEAINNLTQDYNDKILAQKEQLESKFTYNLKEASDSIKKETVVKLSEVYSYINSQSSNLYNEIKNSNNNLENNLNYKLWDIYKTNENQNYEINTIKTKLEDKIEKSEIQKTEEKTIEKINELNLEHTKVINNMRLEFEDKLNQQRIKYETKLMNMEKLIQKIKEEQEEAKKNIFVKLIKKIKR